MKYNENKLIKKAKKPPWERFFVTVYAIRWHLKAIHANILAIR